MAVRQLGALAAVIAGLAAAPAGAQSPPPVDFSFTFSETAPGSPTDAALHILYKDPEDPENPDGKSPALTEVIIAAPPGTVFDGTAVPACRASDAELMLLGTNACPEESNVGGGFGSVVLDPGPSDPLTADVTLLNYGEGIVELFTLPGTPMPGVIDRARFEGQSTMVLHPAVVPGITEREFSFTYHGKRGSAGRAFITTPPECPPTGVWTSQLTYTVTTGATYSATATTPCVPAATPALANEPDAIRASVRPRRVRAGRRVRIQVRLRSSDTRCIANATVRLAGRRAVRTSRAGRATIVGRFRGPGRRTVIASKRGCATGRAILTVLPAT
jgi:hypothetical protein